MSMKTLIRSLVFTTWYCKVISHGGATGAATDAGVCVMEWREVYARVKKVYAP